MRHPSGESDVERDLRIVSELVLLKRLVSIRDLDECVEDIRRRYRRGEPKLPSLADLLLEKRLLSADQREKLRKLQAAQEVPPEPKGRRSRLLLAVGAAVAALVLLFALTCKSDEARRAEAEAFFQQAVAAHEGGDLERAIVLYGRALPHHPKPIDVHWRRGTARADCLDGPGAVADLVEVVRSRPRDADALARLGLARLSAGDANGALAELDKALAVEAGRAPLYVARARAKLALSDYADAIADCTRAVERDPTDAAAFALRAEARRITGDTALALQDWGSVSALKPRDPDSRLERGRLLLATGEPAKAAAEAEEALRMAPPNWPRRAEAGQLLEKLRR